VDKEKCMRSFKICMQVMEVEIDGTCSNHGKNEK
jgi:hypothetical protein